MVSLQIPFVKPIHFNCATLNINGLNCRNKQLQLLSLFKYHNLDVLLVQEHNVQDVKKLDVLLDFFEILINPTALLKGGTMILIAKRAHIKVLNTEMDDNGNVLYARISFFDTIIPVLNVCDSSGTRRKGGIVL